MSDINVSERFTSESDAVDDVYGEYPFLLYKHFFITRRNILRFLKQMTNINQRMTLSPEERNQIEHLETLIEHRLHIVTVRHPLFPLMFFHSEIEFPLERIKGEKHPNV